MNTVRIFLASSAELDNDKKELEIFFSQKNKDLHSSRIYLELTTWKDFISAIREGRTKDEYNRYIRSSDISIFLFHTKLGRYTREEFDNAHEAFLLSKGRYKKPRIYTYFKTDLNEQPEITKFREHIDSLDHFYDTYESMDDLFVKFDRQLDKLENEGARKAIELAQKNNFKETSYQFIYTNLAHALLFLNKYDAAKNIYEEWKDKIFPNDTTKTFRYFFLQDFDELQKAGITHPDMNKIKELINKGCDGAKV